MDKLPSKIPWWQSPLFLFMKISGWIAFPVIIALIVGKKLDAKYDTDPWIFIGLTTIAFITSITAITKICIKYIKDLKNINTNKDDSGK